MTEHIIANIEFAKKNQKNLSCHPLNFLSPYLGLKNDVAVLPQQASSDFIDQLENLNAPCMNVKIIDECEKIRILNPWMITEEILLLSQKLQCDLKFPHSPLIEKLDSKIELYSFFPNNHEIKTLETKEEILLHLNGQSDLYVLKKEHSQSGQGHFFIHPNQLDSNLEKLELKGRYRLEKWYDRVFDFSTQWLLNDSVKLLGACELQNTSKGVFKASIYPFENKQYEPFVQDHIDHAWPVLEKIHTLGFRGHLGLDAFIYDQSGKLRLYPVCEINPRKTMGYLALHLAKHYKQKVKIELGNSQLPNCLLPKQLTVNTQLVVLKKNLNLSFL
jgi:hypothetical protein